MSSLSVNLIWHLSDLNLSLTKWMMGQTDWNRLLEHIKLMSELKRVWTFVRVWIGVNQTYKIQDFTRIDREDDKISALLSSLLILRSNVKFKPYCQSHFSTTISRINNSFLCEIDVNISLYDMYTLKVWFLILDKKYFFCSPVPQPDWVIHKNQLHKHGHCPGWPEPGEIRGDQTRE